MSAGKPRPADGCPWPHKHRHACLDDAKAAIRALYKAGRGNPDLHAYRCPGGSHWHVGHDRRHLARRARAAIKPGRDSGTTYRPRRAR